MGGSDKESEEPEGIEGLLRRQSRERRWEHQERIQILVAIGLLGGYITAFFGGMFENVLLNAAATIFAALVSFFLLYKLVVNSPFAFSEVLATETTDRIFSAFYIAAIFGFTLVAIVIVGAAQLEIPQEALEQLPFAIVFFVLFPGMFIGMWFIGGRRMKSYLDAQAETIREEMLEVFDMWEEANRLDVSNRKALEERTFRLLNLDESRGWKRLGADLLVAGQRQNILKLNQSDRSRLIAILRRMKTNANYGRYNPGTLRRSK